VQLAHLARSIEELAGRVGTRLAEFATDELHDAGSATLEPDACAAVLDDVCALRDAAEQAGMIGGDFTPHGRTLTVPLEALCAAAADALAAGSSDPSLIHLTVKLLDRDTGFAALAEGIDADPIGHVGQWGDMTVGGLLGEFRDADRRATAEVCSAAGVNAETLWTNLGVDALARVSWALHRAPSG